MFRFAGQPDLYRAWQKDRSTIREVQEETREVAMSLLGGPWAGRHERQLDLLASAAYYGLTTVLGYKTLGEEYTDILPVTSASRGSSSSSSSSSSSASRATYRAPGLQRKLAFVCLEVCLPYVYKELLERSRRGGSSTTGRSWVVRFVLGCWQKMLALLKHTEPLVKYLQKSHLMLFYFFGTYLQLARRATGTRYLFVRELHAPRPGYQLLGVLIFVQTALTSILFANDRWKAHMQARETRERESLLGAGTTVQFNGISAADDEDEDEHADCILCMCPRTNTTVTDCGHLFCWECISECCTNKPECPLCRQPQAVSSLLRLANYKKVV